MHVYITIWKGERGTGEPWGYYCGPWPGPPGSWPVERLRCIRHVWEAINKKESLLLANTPILAWCSILQTCISHNFSLMLHIFGQVWSVPYKLRLPQEQRCTLLLARVELLRDWQNQICTNRSLLRDNRNWSSDHTSKKRKNWRRLLFSTENRWKKCEDDKIPRK